MLLEPAIQGFWLGLSMILPIGAQNSLILNQGIQKHHHVLAATICALCDASLIGLGVYGAGHLLMQSQLMMNAITLGGAGFLMVYGALSLKSAFTLYQPAARSAKHAPGVAGVVGATLAVTLLNPHVYLDTVVILGGVGGQFSGQAKLLFAFGCGLASIVWFYSLALGAARLSIWLNRPKVKRLIDLLIALIMWAIAAKLIIYWSGTASF